MKTNWLVGSVLLAGAMLLRAQTNDLSAALRQGLFEEEANRNLDAAISNYQALTTQFDQDRQIAATAIFRLGECYRKLGRTNDAVGQYQRIVREFADSQTLVALSQQNLNALHAAVPPQWITAPQLPAPAGTFQERLQAIIAKAPPGSTAGTSAELAAKAVELEAEAAQLRVQIEHLSGLNREDARVAVQQNFPNPVLTSLLQQLNEAEQTLATLTNDYSRNDLHVTRVTSQVNAINSQIDAQVDGVLKGLQAKMEADLDAAKTLRAQAGSVPSNRSADVTDDEAKEIQRIQQMIQNSPDLINAERGDDAPLYAAAGKGQLRVAGFLLDHGANIEGANHHVPLLAAARNGNRAMVELLLSRGADVNAKENDGSTALHYAAGRGFQSVAEVLLANKADVNSPDNDGKSPLHLAVRNGQKQIVQMLLTAGANPNGQDNAGRTPLSYAAGSGSVETVKALLDAKADPNGGKLDAPLLASIYKPDAASAELLLKNGAKPNQTGLVDWSVQGHGFPYQGATVSPLYLAVNQNEPAIMRLLLQFKADPNETNLLGAPLLFDAIPHLDILAAMLDAGADPNRPDLNFPGRPDLQGESPLMSAVGNSFYETPDGNLVAAGLLLAHGANTTATNRDGNTALHWTVGLGGLENWKISPARRELVELLLDHHADPNAKNIYGKTPLDLLKDKIAQNFAQNSPAGAPNNIRELKAFAGELADLLRQHGALDNLPDWDRIEVSRPSANYSETVFRKGTNDWNRFTVLELIARQYGFITSERSGPSSAFGVINNQNWINFPLSFPDFKHVVIHRPAPDGRKWTSIPVDVEAMLESGDCFRDVSLQWGDVVEIPETDHRVSDEWQGFPAKAGTNLIYCIARSVQIVVQDRSTEFKPALEYVTLGPSVSDFSRISSSFMVRAVLDQSKLIRFSSDLSRVKVTRRDPKTGRKIEWVLDCRGAYAPDLWLRDGDVIEVPEK